MCHPHSRELQKVKKKIQVHLLHPPLPLHTTEPRKTTSSGTYLLGRENKRYRRRKKRATHKRGYDGKPPFVGCRKRYDQSKQNRKPQQRIATLWKKGPKGEPRPMTSHEAVRVAERRNPKTMRLTVRSNDRGHL